MTAPHDAEGMTLRFVHVLSLLRITCCVGTNTRVPKELRRTTCGGQVHTRPPGFARGGPRSALHDDGLRNPDRRSQALQRRGRQPCHNRRRTGAAAASFLTNATTKAMNRSLLLLFLAPLHPLPCPLLRSSAALPLFRHVRPRRRIVADHSGEHCRLLMGFPTRWYYQKNPVWCGASPAGPQGERTDSGREEPDIGLSKAMSGRDRCCSHKLALSSYPVDLLTSSNNMDGALGSQVSLAGRPVPAREQRAFVLFLGAPAAVAAARPGSHKPRNRRPCICK